MPENDIDYGHTVDQIMEQLSDRNSCSFIDDGNETWEIKRSTELGAVFAMCPARDALLKIEQFIEED